MRSGSSLKRSAWVGGEEGVNAMQRLSCSHPPSNDGSVTHGAYLQNGVDGVNCPPAGRRKRHKGAGAVVHGEVARSGFARGCGSCIGHFSGLQGARAIAGNEDGDRRQGEEVYFDIVLA